MDVENKISKKPTLQSAVTFNIFLFAVKYAKCGKFKSLVKPY